MATVTGLPGAFLLPFVFVRRANWFALGAFATALTITPRALPGPFLVITGAKTRTLSGGICFCCSSGRIWLCKYGRKMFEVPRRTFGAALAVRPCTLSAPALRADDALMWTLFVDFWTARYRQVCGGNICFLQMKALIATVAFRPSALFLPPQFVPNAPLWAFLCSNIVDDLP